MKSIELVRCPNCGKLAERQYFPKQQIAQISCSACDYFLVSCPKTGKVLECYAPGLYSVR